MDALQSIRLPADGSPVWAGMADCQLLSPDGAHRIDLPYLGEPPHGDSYHRMEIDGASFPGHAWGGLFAMTADSQYLAFSWKPSRSVARPSDFERKTVVVDLTMRRYFVLPTYIYKFRFVWPLLEGSTPGVGDIAYRFTGSEQWRDY
jgi:hypothetical protein